MKTFMLLFAVSIFFLLSGCSENIPVSPQENVKSLAKVPVPFKMDFQGILNVTPNNPPSSGSGLLEGWGTGTHMGKYTSTSTNNYVLTSATTGNILNGVHTTIAANGDEMYATYTGSWITDTSGTYIYTLNFIWTGGTGRFINLQGTLPLTLYATNVVPGNPLVKNTWAHGESMISY